MREAPTLIDGVLRELERPLYHRIGFVDPLRRQLAEAHKFVLDDSMSGFLSDLAYAALMTTHHSDDKAHLLLESLRTQARLPHRLTWIEYSQTPKRVRANAWNPSVHIDAGTFPDRGGWLLIQHPQVETAFMARLFSSHAWDRETRTRVYCPQPNYLSYQWRVDDGPLAWNQPQVPPRYLEHMSVVGSLSGILSYRTAQAGIAPSLFPMDIYERMLVNEIDRGLNPLKEFASDMRYLWALLATINNLPTGMTEVRQARGYIDRRGRRRSFVTHKVITLHVPEKRYKRLAMRAVAVARRPRHEVRGHYRTNWRDPLGAKIWIKEHERGDASLGFVRHDYQVTHGDQET